MVQAHILQSMRGRFLAADRVTQCIHQAGDRLTKSKEIRAKNFWMKAMPAVIVPSTGKPIDN
jgi:hypothetical protein